MRLEFPRLFALVVYTSCPWNFDALHHLGEQIFSCRRFATFRFGLVAILGLASEAVTCRRFATRCVGIIYLWKCASTYEARKATITKSPSLL